MKTNDVLIGSDSLYAPLAETFTEVDFDYFSAIRGDEPQTADLGHALRGVALLYFDCLDVLA